MERKISSKEKILYAALELFSQKGYDGVGVDLIAETVGMKGPSIYKHFKGKEDIYNTLIDVLDKHYNDNMNRVKENMKLPENTDELYVFSLRHIEFTLNDEHVKKARRILAIEQFRDEKTANITSEHHLFSLVDLYEPFFKHLIEVKAIKPYDPNMLAVEYVSAPTLLIHLADRSPEKTEWVLEKIKEHFDHFIEVYKC